MRITDKSPEIRTWWGVSNVLSCMQKLHGQGELKRASYQGALSTPCPWSTKLNREGDYILLQHSRQSLSLGGAPGLH